MNKEENGGAGRRQRPGAIPRGGSILGIRGPIFLHVSAVTDKSLQNGEKDGRGLTENF